MNRPIVYSLEVPEGARDVIERITVCSDGGVVVAYRSPLVGAIDLDGYEATHAAIGFSTVGVRVLKR